ncbi:hypothetical protein DSM104443_02357 [Usitatibacter rugosus]|uniref:Uncharacterized protein n=1 Tax=Usitatibacter rugosus TaxID=2732067 RepID=A0A6M4GXS1_9PROT|nr:hypothetical protein [Usitatibacter rugosus]QJR11284.1 hypothetical protein DSM104443_02357 [Usitatibacter rugosus]
MRAAVGGALIVHAAARMNSAAPLAANAFPLTIGVLGALLVAGLWTPATALMTAGAAAWIAISQQVSAAPWFFVFVIATALVLLGPGAWSIDAHLFGWKRVNGHGEKEGPSPPD